MNIASQSRWPTFWILGQRYWKAVFFSFIFCLFSCENNVIDCEDEERTLAAIDIAASFFSSKQNLESMRVICRNEREVKIPIDGERVCVHCFVQWFGGDGIYSAASIEAESNIAPECVIHESMHIELYQINGRTYNSACGNHSNRCGWNETIVEQLTQEIP